MEHVLNCSGLSFGYDGKTVLHDVSFYVEQGDYLCILGENGAGKSTLVKGLLSLIKPQAGSLQKGAGLHDRETGYLPQQTVVQRDFPASVYEVVLSGCLNSLRIRPFYSRAEKARAAENMEKLGITHLKKRPYRALSGGQQQRVLLARALCATRRLLLLDEPTAGLDPVATNGLYDIIERINKELGITIIMVTHDVHAAVKYAKHILQLNHTVEFFGTRDEYINSGCGKKFLGREAAHA